MSPKQVTDATFQAEVLEASKPVLVDFWASWCGPCRMIAPVLEELAAEMSDQIEVAKIDVDANNFSPSQFGVRSIPTLILFKGGHPVATSVGFKDKNALKSWVLGYIG